MHGRGEVMGQDGRLLELGVYGSLLWLRGAPQIPHRYAPRSHSNGEDFGNLLHEAALVVVLAAAWQVAPPYATVGSLM